MQSDQESDLIEQFLGKEGEEYLEPIEETAEEDLSRLVVRRFSSIEAKPLRWLWPGKIPMGKVSLLIGDPGIGKSLITLDIATRISTGSVWPDAEATGWGQVLILSAEDDPADTIRPRLECIGADLDRIMLLEAVKHPIPSGEVAECVFSFASDMSILMHETEKWKNLRLLVVDPITAYLDTIDSHINAQIRGLLGYLAEFAKRRECAVLCVSHLNKGYGPAIYRVSGSIGFAAAARSIWACCKDKADEEGVRRLFLPVKNNLAPDTGGLSYEIVPGNVPSIGWLNAVNADITEVLMPESSAEQEERNEAREWLSEFLDGRSVPAVEVFREARRSGYREKLIRRIAKELGVQKQKVGYQGKWEWSIKDAKDSKDFI